MTRPEPDPAVPDRPVPDPGCRQALAVDLSGTGIAVGLVTATGEIPCSQRIPVGGDGARAGVRGIVRGDRRRAARRRTRPGRSRRHRGNRGDRRRSARSRVGGGLSGRNPAWRRFTLRDRLADRYARSVRIIADGVAMTIAEHWRGAGRGRRNVLGHRGRGEPVGRVGARRVAGGRHHRKRGADRSLCVDPAGPPCVCGAVRLPAGRRGRRGDRRMVRSAGREATGPPCPSGGPGRADSPLGRAGTARSADRRSGVGRRSLGGGHVPAHRRGDRHRGRRRGDAARPRRGGCRRRLWPRPGRSCSTPSPTGTAATRRLTTRRFRGSSPGCWAPTPLWWARAPPCCVPPSTGPIRPDPRSSARRLDRRPAGGRVGVLAGSTPWTCLPRTASASTRSARPPS